MDGTLSILLVEDNDGDAKLVERHLRTDTAATFDRPTVTRVEALAPAVEAMAERRVDLVLLDLGLPGSSGIETLERLTGQMEDRDGIEPTPVIVLTGLDDERRALEAIQAGAQDYLTKGDIDGDMLGRSVRYALERHEQEQELKRQNERLERFAAVVSHDLRNPLNAVQTAADVALTETEPGSRAHTGLQQVKRATERMSEIIDDVLTLARQGQSVDETEVVHLGRLVRDCWTVVEADDVTLAVSADQAIRADPGRLRQLLENLLRNAVEHGGSATDAEDGLTIRVETTETGFVVADDGPGIPESEREEVFEVGYTTDDRGTGFGLNIVKDIAEAHGWRVSLGESADGGARFEVTGVEAVESEPAA